MKTTPAMSEETRASFLDKLYEHFHRKGTPSVSQLADLFVERAIADLTRQYVDAMLKEIRFLSDAELAEYQSDIQFLISQARKVSTLSR